MKQNKIQACDKYLADVRIVVINKITAVLPFLTRQKQFRSKSDLFASADGQHLPQCSTLFQQRKDWPFNRCVHMKAKKTARKCNCLTRFSHRLQFPFLACFQMFYLLRLASDRGQNIPNRVHVRELYLVPFISDSS